MFEVVREYSHRRFGSIGRVVMAAKVGEVKINGEVIPASSVEYLLNFALQSLQDAYAGADNEQEAKGFFESKLDKLIKGTIGVRASGGTSVSEETKIARSITKVRLMAAWGKNSPAAIEFKESDKSAQDAKLDEVYEKNKAKLKPFVDEKLKELKKERERAALLAQSANALDF